ncbi:MAG TPA: EamA family transporter, partial [Candidatus Thermoplasmatota archaeon]|nr:EamA family transporter [Candidatus Thermoplasmatota archaeon]
PRRKAFWALVALNAAGFLLQYVGQTMTTPARTALLVNASAFAVALLERFAFGMRLGPARTLAIVAGVAGASLLVAGGDWRSLEGGRLLGDLLALGSGLAWSVYTVLNREAAAREDPLSLLAWTFALTAVVLLPALALDDAPLSVPAAGWGPILWAGLATTALAYALWTFGLRAIRATTSAVLLLVEILVASALSFAIGRETFGPWDYAGAAMLVGAVLAMTLLAPEDQKA